MKVAAAVQKTICASCHLLWAKELLPRHPWVIFSRGYIELNAARNQNLCHQHEIWLKLQLAFCLLLLAILQLYHLPPSLPFPVSNTSCLFTRCLPLYASCFTVLLHFSRYCTVRLKIFPLCVVWFYMYYLCEKYYKPITAQDYVTYHVSWISRLTLLYLRTCWIYERALSMELVHKWGTYSLQK